MNGPLVELWSEVSERLKSLVNRAQDVVELHLDSGNLNVSLAAAKYVLQGTGPLGETDLPKEGPTTPESVIMAELRTDARRELAAKEGPAMPRFEFDPFRAEIEVNFKDKVEALAKSRLQKAMANAGLA
ncbi:MAG: hypothetical protein WA137_09805 [Methanothrix sp.]